MSHVVIAAVVGYVAFVNGANDNFKGLATVWGAEVASYRRSIVLATAAQIAGSFASVLLASALVATFSAKGLVPDAVVSHPAFFVATAVGAGSTVLLATLCGMPVSTTHGLTGALLGVGLVAAGFQHVNLRALGGGFLLPLLVSPFLAAALAAAFYPLARTLQARLGISREACVCIGNEWVPVGAVLQAGGASAAVGGERVRIAVGDGGACAERYRGTVLGVSVQQAVDAAHLACGVCVCFARALNDTPKVVAILLGAKSFDADVSLPLVAIAMSAGGVIGSRKVAVTLSKKITRLSTGQGLVASFSTAALVLVASRFGLPVSSTHVATGSIFGLGLSRGDVRFGTMAAIASSWVLTLPIAMAAGAAAFAFLR